MPKLTTEEILSMRSLADELEPWGAGQGDEYGEYLLSLCDLARQIIPDDFIVHVFNELNANIAWCNDNLMMINHEEEVVTYNKWTEVVEKDNG